MRKLYQWIDSLWQWIAERVFVRFEFNLPVSELRKLAEAGRLSFALTSGGFVEWLILSSWCRKEGFGAILIANRRRILLFAKPLYFFQICFKRKSYAELFLSEEHGPRLLICPFHERKQPFDPTPAESLLSGIYNGLQGRGFFLVPIFVLWRKHVRGAAKKLSEHFLGLGSSPNLIGKIWYLARQRKDSAVRSLTPITMEAKENSEGTEIEETEAMRAAKNARRRILVQVNQEMRVVLGPRYLSPHSVKENLLKDPDILKAISDVAQTSGQDRKRVMMLAYKNLTEIVANYQYRTIEFMYLFLSWLFTRVFKGVNVNEKELQNVREVMKTKPVVFICAHRSHFDYLVIPYVLFMQDMVTPHIAAGLNMAFWPMSTFMRSGGAFFIRRSFRGDGLYTVCLRKYIEYLLKNRYNIKYFIEGTRSRTGKMLAPAYGLLKMVMEPCRNKVIEDIALVPVSICYEELPEQGAYSKELLGAQKDKENARALFRSRKVIKTNFGKVYVRFADPISVKDTYQLAGGAAPTLTLQKTAFQICKSINDVSPITARAIVSTVFLAHPMASLPLQKVHSIGT
ncbi:MAG: 1-acyl-sn-glycerol-3-phosphate acyltransferase, partial [Deltaproteobacteria bacterium]|nr:1-acyl-sn-glycerol-3-phosphate acyltransferase [Deltaproteobacteria bacterium]